MIDPEERVIIEKVVDKGIKVLEQNYRYWLDAINLEELDLASTQYCVLGQVFGSYETGTDILADDEIYADEYGFDIPEGITRTGDDFIREGYTEVYDEMTVVWRERITDMRKHN